LGKNYIPSTKQQDKIRTDMIGMRFGRLIVQSYSHSKKNEGRAGYKHYYNCICDCGNTYVGERNALRFHNTESCGCIHSETLIKRNQETASHNGDSKEYQRLYNIWYSMRNRCDSLSNKDYRYYGGKGVKVCNEWYEWENFKQWALGNGYEEDLTIDRIDVDGDYKPSNCRWVTMQVQANNKTVNHYITYDGRTQSLSDWCRELNLDYDRTKQRINACGMTPEQAFTLPKYYT
jgi:hypothetical protein